MKIVFDMLYLEEVDDNRVNIIMNNKYMVGIILTSQGFIFDVYDYNGEELLDTTMIEFDGDGKFIDENSHRYQAGYCNECAGNCQYDDQGNWVGDSEEDTDPSFVKAGRQ